MKDTSKDEATRLLSDSVSLSEELGFISGLTAEFRDRMIRHADAEREQQLIIIFLEMENIFTHTACWFWFHLSDTPKDSYHHSAFTYRQKHPESDPMHYLVEKHQLNSTIRCKHPKVKETETITQEEYIHDWQQKVTQVKKFTYFHSIKSDYKLAPYLSIIKGYGQRKLLTKYRLSEHSLCVETHRERESVCVCVCVCV